MSDVYSRSRNRRNVTSVYRDSSPSEQQGYVDDVHGDGVNSVAVTPTFPMFASLNAFASRSYVAPQKTAALPSSVFAEDLDRETELLAKQENANNTEDTSQQSNLSLCRDEIIAYAPQLQEPCASVYITCTVEDLIERVLFILQRDHIRQKDLAASINLSGSTLSPMLHGKYKHTRGAHIAKLREWVFIRDKLYAASAVQQAVLSQFNESTFALRLNVDRNILARWLAFTLPLKMRTTIDTKITSWVEAETNLFDIK